MNTHINARDLCRYGLDAVGGGYVFGSSGQISTLAFRQSCAAANPSQKENILGLAAKWDGRRVWDCSGIFRGAWRTLWQYRSGGATTIFNTWCTVKGVIGSMPDLPGVAVFRDKNGVKEHCGLYVGGGMVVDARGTAQGVLHGTLASYRAGWTHWALLDEVDYENSTTTPDEIHALWSGYVRTRTGGGISLWVDNSKKTAVARIPEKAMVDVLDKPDELGFAPAHYIGKFAVADLQYVVSPDAEKPIQHNYMAVVTGVNTGLNLRETPNLTSGNTILLIPNQKEVEVFPDLAVGDFAYVRYVGKTGYSTAGYLVRQNEAVDR